MFFDEINTCDHLGLLTNIICDRKMDGQHLHPLLVPMGACNPYRRKPKRAVIAGFDSKQLRTPDHMSKLVYRVHPLPHTLLDFSYDFGMLAVDDERLYIRSILAHVRYRDRPPPEDLVELFTRIVSVSQQWIRETLLDVSAASMRDVKRCAKLFEWFSENELGPPVKFTRTPWRKYIILAASHCYRSRLPTSELRIEYEELVARQLDWKPATVRDVILEEQQAFLLCMQLENGIACNEALRENVFTILVCILLRLPVFLVGKPGCSKSLAIQLIASNFRGRDSVHDQLKKYPEVKVKLFFVCIIVSLTSTRSYSRFKDPSPAPPRAS
jgi:hypothetical protein